MMDRSVKAIAGSASLGSLLDAKNRRAMRRVAGFRRFLVNPDSHIGDAIMGQSMVTAIRDFFPGAEVDFIANTTASPLVEGNPFITKCFPVYGGGAFPRPSELSQVKELIRLGGYDVCFNSCPFIKGAELGDDRPVFDFLTHIPTIVRNESVDKAINHFSYQFYQFVRKLLADVAMPAEPRPFELTVTLDAAAVAEASEFTWGMKTSQPVAMLNPETASLFTQMPFAFQVELLNLLVDEGAFVWVSAGHSQERIGEALVASLSAERRASVKVVPSGMSLGGYAALIDRADLFVTGDTGPMHIAAAKKMSRSGNHVFRNRTAVLNLFGATPARMSGYDSRRPGYLPGNQDAPAWCIQPASECRNILCVNKLYKTCEVIRCFGDLKLDHVAGLISPYLRRHAVLAMGEEVRPERLTAKRPSEAPTSVPAQPVPV
jgi:ADP-heptose:LPS heptosyltransferase